jgi:hypothetical protein
MAMKLRIQAQVLAAAVMLMPAVATAQDSSNQSTSRETTDVYIRRLAGLPASSAQGDIEIIDVGHLPMDTMLSIVAKRGPSLWHVSYACAQSPHCSDNADHRALDYDLSADATRRVDAILADLKSGGAPGGTDPSPTMMCGNLTVTIDYQGFKRDYVRSCSWGRTLGDLETLLMQTRS